MSDRSQESELAGQANRTGRPRSSLSQQNQLSILPLGGERFSQEVDSGSLVVTETQPFRPLAMTFAGGDAGPSFATPLERILKRFAAKRLERAAQSANKFQRSEADRRTAQVTNRLLPSGRRQGRN